MNLVIRLVLFCMLVAEGIESNHWPQTGSTRANSSPRGGQRDLGRGCNGCGSRQDHIGDAFADTSALYHTSSIKITKSTVSYFSTVSELLVYRLPNSDSTGRIK